MTFGLGTEYSNYDNRFIDTSTSRGSPTEETEIGLDQFPYRDEVLAGLYELKPFNFKKSETYDTGSQNVVLPPPSEKVSSESLSTTQQSIVRETYIDQAMRYAQEQGLNSKTATKVINYLITGNAEGLSPENLAIAAKIGAQAQTQTIQKMGLSEGWKIDSDPSTWTAKQLVAYNEVEQADITKYYQNQREGLAETYINEMREQEPPSITQEQAEAIRTAIKSNSFIPGASPDPMQIAQGIAKINAFAAASTSAKYGLAETWSPTNAVETNWIPINSIGLNPKATNLAAMNKVIDGADALLETTQAAMRKAAESNIDAIKSEGKEYLASLIDFLMAIKESLRTAREAINQSQVADSEKTKKFSQAQSEETQARFAAGEKRMESIRAQIEAEKKAKSMSFWMKIGAIAISAAALVVAVASLGTLSWVSGIAITLAVGMFTFTCVDAAMDITPSLASKMGSWMEAVAAFLCESLGVDSKEMRTFIKVLIIVAIIAVMVAVILATGGSAAGGAAQAGMQAAGQAAAVQMIKQTITQAAIQLMMILLMDPSGIPEIATDICIACNPNATEHDKMVAKMVAMALVMAVLMVSMASSAAGGFKKLLSNINESAKDFAKSVRSMGDVTWESFKQNLRTAMQNLKDALTMPGKQYATQMAMRWEIKDVMQKMKWFLNTATAGMEAYKGIKLWEINVQLAQITKDLGDVDSYIEELEELSKILKKIMNSLLSGVSQNSNDLEEITQLLNKVFKSSGQSFSQFAAAINPAAHSRS